MARPLRLEFAGAIYHLTSRGDGREAIFLDDQDREGFLSVLAAVVGRYHWRLHAYCLMGNHYHLLVETPEPNLSRGMRHLNGVYTQRFNRRHHRVGHVFQGRFKAIVVERDAYLLELVRYIVLNPVRARMHRKVHVYPWSSYRATAGLAPAPEWLTVGWLLGQFGASRARARRRYTSFVEAGIGTSAVWGELRQQIYLGSEEFVERQQKRLPAGQDLSEIPRAQHRSPAKPLAAYAAAYNDPHAAMAAAYRSGDYSLATVGRYFGVHYSTVSRAVKNAEDKD
jgi:REP element-mobilizing transposase RayT